MIGLFGTDSPVADRPDSEQHLFDFASSSKHGDPTVQFGKCIAGCCACCGDRLKEKTTCSYCGFDNTEVK